MSKSSTSRTLWQGLALAGIIASSVASTSTAFAGECPADKMKANVREKVDYKPVGVTDVTLGAINLEKQPALWMIGSEQLLAYSTISPCCT